MVSQVATTFVQVLSVIASIGVMVCGMIHLRGGGGSAKLDIEWCDSKTPNPTTAECFEDNFGANLDFAMTIYGGALIGIGAIAFMVGARSEGWFPALQPWKYLSLYNMLMGVYSLGAASNTGIIVGSFAILVGFSMFLMAILGNVVYGIDPSKQNNVPRPFLKFVQFMAALLAAGAVIVGVMCVISQARNDNAKLEWCRPASNTDEDEEVCWRNRANANFAWACYGAGICVFGVVAIIATLRMQNWFVSLYPWNILSLYHIFVGLLCLGAAGNTGILIGAIEICFAGIMLLLYVFFGVQGAGLSEAYEK